MKRYVVWVTVLVIVVFLISFVQKSCAGEKSETEWKIRALTAEKVVLEERYKATVDELNKTISTYQAILKKEKEVKKNETVK